MTSASAGMQHRSVWPRAQPPRAQQGRPLTRDPARPARGWPREGKLSCPERSEGVRKETSPDRTRAPGRPDLLRSRLRLLAPPPPAADRGEEHDPHSQDFRHRRRGGAGAGRGGSGRGRGRRTATRRLRRLRRRRSATPGTATAATLSASSRGRTASEAIRATRSTRATRRGRDSHDRPPGRRAQPGWEQPSGTVAGPAFRLPDPGGERVMGEARPGGPPCFAGVLRIGEGLRFRSPSP